MRVLIADDNKGRTGERLCLLLLKKQCEVVVLSRDPDRHKQLSADISCEYWDGESVGSWCRYVDGSTALVNLVCFQPGSDRHEASTRAMCEAISHAVEPPLVLLQASSLHYYGDSGEDMVIEQSPPGNTRQAEQVQLWEGMSEDLPLRRCLLRLGCVLEPGQAEDSLDSIPHQNRRWLPWIHEDDVARALYFLLVNERASGPVNIVAPHPQPLATFRRLLHELMSTRHTQAKSSPIDTTMHQRALPHKLTNLGFSFFFEDMEDALRTMLL